jgi:hypothetical protein
VDAATLSALALQAATTLVWIAPAPPDADQVRALAAWASAHDVQIVEAVEETPRAIAVDFAPASDVEARLDAARDAIAGLDAAAVDRELGAAEALLRAHAELPQAGWLMAEVERARAVRFRRVAPTDPEAAERALVRAEAIDGGRAPGLGEEGAPPRPVAAPEHLELDPAPAAGDVVWLDGRPVETPFEVRAGLHVALVTRQGAPIWASWVDVLPGQKRIALDAPPPAPCSRADVGSARMQPGGVEAASTRCPRWIAAAPGASPREVVVASCQASRCGGPVVWRLPDLRAEPPPSAPASERRWPAWATWSGIGVGAALAVTVVLAATLHSSPAETRYVGYGIKPE